jgi:hypothetical protein
MVNPNLCHKRAQQALKEEGVSAIRSSRLSVLAVQSSTNEDAKTLGKVPRQATVPGLWCSQSPYIDCYNGGRDDLTREAAPRIVWRDSD